MISAISDLEELDRLENHSERLKHFDGAAGVCKLHVQTTHTHTHRTYFRLTAKSRGFVCFEQKSFSPNAQHNSITSVFIIQITGEMTPYETVMKVLKYCISSVHICTVFDVCCTEFPQNVNDSVLQCYFSLMVHL